MLITFEKTIRDYFNYQDSNKIYSVSQAQKDYYSSYYKLEEILNKYFL